MGRKIEKKEKGMSLSIFYLKYFLYLFLAVVVICMAALFSIIGLVVSDMLYPADYAQEQAKAAQTKIKEAAFVCEDLIPDLCQYAVFDFDGNIVDGNIDKTDLKAAWEAVSGKTSDFIGNYYKVIVRKSEYCVLQYKIVPQYKSATLRKYLCPPQTLIMVSTLFFILVSIVIIAIRFGYVLKTKMNALVIITEKIQYQDLDISIEKGNIKEINAVLEAMDKMRDALRLSLENQWKAEQGRKEQISALAHDLKTPLTIIRGNAELLYDTNPTEEQVESIHYIEESSLQMQSYIKMLIELAKDTDLYHPQYQMLPFFDFAEDIHTTARGLCSSKKITLKWDFRSRLQTFCVDAGLLNRALGNVLSNAVENSPQGGIVRVEIFDEEGCIAFSISDSGKGFSKEAMKYATAQFYRDDASRNSKTHFGIGLYFADTIIKLHGGQLILENLEERPGAKVTIKIPVG